MTLIAGTAIELAEHRLQGAISPTVSALRVVNETGRILCGVRNWNWLQGQLDSLTLTAGQAYIDLPPGVTSVRAVDRGDGYRASFAWVTLESLLEIRSNAPALASPAFFGAIAYDHADIVGETSTPSYTIVPTTEEEAKAKRAPTPRIELYPTPEATGNLDMLLYYTRGWSEVYEDTDPIFIPDWMEPLYVAMLRHRARYYENESEGNFDYDSAMRRLVGVPNDQRSPGGIEWEAAVRQDHQMQPDLGRLEGGAAQAMTIYGYNSYTKKAIGGPF